MTGLRIFSHSVFLLNHNFKDAVKISWPLLVMILLRLTLVGSRDLAGGDGDLNSVQIGDVLQIVGSAFVGVWVAVAWHRYVLLEEVAGPLPPFRGRSMLAYFVTFFWIFAAVVIIALLLAFVLVAVVPMQPNTVGTIASGMIGVLVAVLGIWLFYRLSPLLPAAALGETLSIREAWAVTAQISWAVLLAVLIWGLAVLAIGAVVQFVLTPISFPIGMLASGLLNWASTMVGISILTTIYGIAVEGREI